MKLFTTSYRDRAERDLQSEAGASAMRARLEKLKDATPDGCPASPRLRPLVAQIEVARRAQTRHEADARRRNVQEAIERGRKAAATEIKAAEKRLQSAKAAAADARATADRKATAATEAEQRAAAELAGLHIKATTAGARLDALADAGTPAEQQQAADVLADAEQRVADAGRSGAARLAQSLRRTAEEATQAAEEAATAATTAEHALHAAEMEAAAVESDAAAGAYIEAVLRMRAAARRSPGLSLPSFDWPAIYFAHQERSPVAGMTRPGFAPSYALRQLADAGDPLDLSVFNVDPETLPLHAGSQAQHPAEADDELAQEVGQ